jgi:hypothetical protein
MKAFRCLIESKRYLIEIFLIVYVSGMAKEKVTPVIVRLTDHQIKVLDALRKKIGLNRTAAMRFALARTADAEGIEVPEKGDSR